MEFDAEMENSCMFIRGKKTLNPDEQLALFMHKFNLDWDTIECMPAFEQHCKKLLIENQKKIHK